MDLLMKEIELESEKAQTQYSNFNSTHEIYGVLMEEVQEFFDVVKRPGLDKDHTYPLNAIDKKSEDLVKELSQIASIAIRASYQLRKKQIKWI